METRKNIRLRDYDYSQPGYHYITICTCDRQPLFDSWVGAHLCVRPDRTPDDPIGSWLFELERKFPGTEIDTYCVMPDHIHVILVLTGAHAGAPLPVSFGSVRFSHTGRGTRPYENRGLTTDPVASPYRGRCPRRRRRGP